DGKHHGNLMAERVHGFELPVEIVPFGPARNRAAASARSLVCVSATIVRVGAGKAVTPMKVLQDRARPPMKMGVDDFHGSAPNCHESRARHQSSFRHRTEPG